MLVIEKWDEFATANWKLHIQIEYRILICAADEFSETLSPLVSVIKPSPVSRPHMGRDVCSHINMVFVVAISASTTWNINKLCFCQMNRRPNTHSTRDTAAQSIYNSSRLFIISISSSYFHIKIFKHSMDMGIGQPHVSSFTVDTCT